MKTILTILFYLTSIQAMANTLTCEVIDTNTPQFSPKRYLKVEVNQHLDSIVQVHKILQNDGSYKDYPETLYGPDFRGMKVSDCSPDRNEVDEVGTIQTYSHCVLAANSAEELWMEVSLSQRTKGNIRISVFAFGNVERNISVAACK